LELVRRARSQSDVVVVSIFVNPTQFDRKDDFELYPRDDAGDSAMLERERVDVLFMPAADRVYGPGAATRVRVGGLTETLCGPRRPGHFDGVATVVAALLNMVAPDRAWFGEKDYQQLQVVRRMVRDLHIPVEILGVPTFREGDGLAMSSRNARLTADQRAIAPAVHRALAAATEAYLAGETLAPVLIERAHAVLARNPELRPEYLEVVDGETLQPVATADDRSVIAAAVWLGGVRLIDNVIFARALEARASRRGHEAAANDLAGGANPDA
jgi:pantoate--beta-alanine ligase